MKRYISILLLFLSLPAAAECVKTLHVIHNDVHSDTVSIGNTVQAAGSVSIKGNEPFVYLVLHTKQQNTHMRFQLNGLDNIDEWQEEIQSGQCAAVTGTIQKLPDSLTEGILNITEFQYTTKQEEFTGACGI